MTALEADCPNVQADADFIGECGGRSFGRPGHTPALHENNGRTKLRLIGLKKRKRRIIILRLVAAMVHK